MKTIISGLGITTIVFTTMLPISNLNAQTPSSSKVDSMGTITVTPVPAENGIYTINP